MKPPTQPAVETIVSRAEELVNDIFKAVEERQIMSYNLPYKCSLHKNIMLFATKDIDKELLKDEDFRRQVKLIVNNAINSLGEKLAGLIEECIGLPSGILAYRYNKNMMPFNYPGIMSELDKFQFALRVPRNVVIEKGTKFGDCVVHKVTKRRKKFMLLVGPKYFDLLLKEYRRRSRDRWQGDRLFMISTSTTVILQHIYSGASVAVLDWIFKTIIQGEE